MFDFTGKLELVKAPNRILNRPGVNLTAPLTNNFIGRMRELMLANKGCGLAAPQVGFQFNFFITTDEVVCNPRIIDYGKETETMFEGCLSIPGVTLPIRRSTWIKVRYQNSKFENVVEEITGLRARIFQHEIDHLNGILHPSRFAEMFCA